MNIVHYLDVTLNLNYGSYRPCKKPNDEKNYIHINSDHLPSILKQLSVSIKNGYHLYYHLKKFSKKLAHTMNSTSQTADTKKS